MARLAAAALLALGLLTWPAFADNADTLKTASQLAKDGRYGEAQAMFARLIAVSADDNSAHAALLLGQAQAYFAAGEYGRAEATLTAAQAMPLTDAQHSQAAALADKIRDKLAWMHFEGSSTLSTIHDSRVRHRVSVISSANGVEIIEICDDEPDFDDVGTAENCYFEEVTGDTQAANRNVNIPDWSEQTTDKVEHQVPLDENGSYWRTVGELTQSWQFQASDQDNRAVKVRSGPSWFIPAWQARFDLGASYLSGRQNHVTNLEYFAPLGAIEWRLLPTLKLNANYLYEIRQASPAQQNGYANFADLQARWDATEKDRFTLRGLFRQQAAQFAYNSYVSEEYRANYRRAFNWFELEGGFAEAEVRVRFASFNGPAPSDNGALRRDIVPTGLINIGQDFGRAWAVKLSCSYNEVDSTIPRYQRNDLQYGLSITRNF